MKKALSLILLSLILTGTSFSIVVRNKLTRGNYYQMRFRIKKSGNYKRFVGLYSNKTLDADLLLFDEKKQLIAKVSGTSGKYPKEISFPGSGIYTVRVMAYSGSGPFLMLISNRGELKTILKNIK